MAGFISKFSEVTNSAVKGLLAGSLFGAVGGALLLGTMAGLAAMGTSASIAGAFAAGAILGGLEGASSGASVGILIGAAIGFINVAKMKDAPEASRDGAAALSLAQGVAAGHAIEAQEQAQERMEIHLPRNYRPKSPNFREAVILSAEHTMHRLH
jgi:hypothetical protein